ncbi:hypothetical protein CHM34_17480 [Paludifilum halophilum]|uniref:Uncharacterized protein n=1 Tax=Paludifilum halophilum TaxID=1642702 RepID=A0A235B1Y2_9BACL|nr:hypothetical protein CHM34_17480 [Paludifilum halophilum]
MNHLPYGIFIVSNYILYESSSVENRKVQILTQIFPMMLTFKMKRSGLAIPGLFVHKINE